MMEAVALRREETGAPQKPFVVETRSPWIFGNRASDIGWLFLPGILILVANYFVQKIPGTTLFGIYFFIDYAVIGSGHIYMTGWRTYLNPNERKRLRLYIWTPIALFAAFFAWRYFKLPIIGLIPAYAQFFHHMRQSFGVQKWYQRQNRSFRKTSDFFLYFLCTVPFLIFHFRQTNLNSFLLPNDLLVHPNETIKNALLGVYAAGVLAWIGYEFSIRQHREWNRLGAVALAGGLNGICLIAGRNEIEIMFPLVAYHGVTYLGLVSMSMAKVEKKKYTMRTAFMWLMLTALVFGTYERWIEWRPEEASLFWNSCWAGLYVTPILCHYIFDAFLWKADHPEAKLVYGASN